MPYAEGRIFNDADSHVMETDTWLATYADPKVRDLLPPPDFARTGRMADAIGKKHDWASIDLAANLMNLKGWEAYGATESAERSHALDLLGFNCQLVFPSIAPGQFCDCLPRPSTGLKCSMAARVLSTVPWPTSARMTSD
jgi:uncharacterized protein